MAKRRETNVARGRTTASTAIDRTNTLKVASLSMISTPSTCPGSCFIPVDSDPKIIFRRRGNHQPARL
jgi:hypothetical protein